MLMVKIALFILGICLGSFVNALVWRLHESSKELKKRTPDKKYLTQLSITKGRSICPNCKHQLSYADLVPILSWLYLRGKCRYCAKPISIQYPVVELATGLLFLLSYIWWPNHFSDSQKVAFGLWLVTLTGLVALFVYDLKWKLLPTKIIYFLTLPALIYAAITVFSASEPLKALLNVILAVLIGGGIFYLIFQLSQGKWIGGGDVRLGWLLGLLAGTAANSFLFIFIGALLGSLLSVPLLASGKMKKSTVIPFGPFLIVGIFIVVLFGGHITNWYQNTIVSL